MFQEKKGFLVGRGVKLAVGWCKGKGVGLGSKSSSGDRCIEFVATGNCLNGPAALRHPLLSI